MRVGLIGLGAAGSGLAELLRAARGDAQMPRLVGILVRAPDRYRDVLGRIGCPIVADLGAFLALEPDVVVEAAGHDAVRAYVPDILRRGTDVFAISVGVLADGAVMEAVAEAARLGGSRFRVPSGAVGGLDAIGAAALGGLERLMHTVRKPPGALVPPRTAAEIIQGGEPRELFAGSAREVAIRFPANANVVAAVALVGLGLDRTKARVVADPTVERNTHEIEAEGAFGRLAIRIENTPSKNPKTGRIVPLSILRALRNLEAPIVIGA